MKKELARFSEAQPEVGVVRGKALRRTVDVHALKVAVALDDALARRVVGVAYTVCPSLSWLTCTTIASSLPYLLELRICTSPMVSCYKLVTCGIGIVTLIRGGNPTFLGNPFLFHPYF